MGLRVRSLSIFLLFATTGSAFADDQVDLPRVRPRVGIVPGMAVNVDPSRVDALAQDLADVLATELEVDTIGGLEVRRKLPVEGIPLDCVTQPACVRDTAKRIGADQLLFVVMVNTGASGAIQIDTTWADPITGRTDTRRPIDLAVLEQSRAKFAASATLLLPDARVRKKPEPKGRSFDGRMSDSVPRHLTAPAIGAGIVALVGVGIGIGFGMTARSAYRDCERVAGSCDQSDKDAIRTKSVVADVGLVAGAAGAITAAVLYGTSGKESRLVVGPQGRGAGVTFSGRF